MELTFFPFFFPFVFVYLFFCLIKWGILAVFFGKRGNVAWK